MLMHPHDVAGGQMQAINAVERGVFAAEHKMAVVGMERRVKSGGVGGRHGAFAEHALPRAEPHEGVGGADPNRSRHRRRRRADRTERRDRSYERNSEIETGTSGPAGSMVLIVQF